MSKFKITAFYDAAAWSQDGGSAVIEHFATFDNILIASRWADWYHSRPQCGAAASLIVVEGC